MADLDEQELKAIVEAARVQFDAAHTDREQALRAARLTIQLSSRAIRAAHHPENAKRFDETRSSDREAAVAEAVLFGMLQGFNVDPRIPNGFSK